MTGMFELFIDDDTSFKFRLKAPDGTVVAVSMSFPDKLAAVCGISDVREYAGMGLITDLCPEVPVYGPSPTPPTTAEKQAGLSGIPQLPALPRHHIPRPARDRSSRPWHTGDRVEAPCVGLVEA